ncbi:MAG TPA: chorismate mutase [Gammaproteobacteria bacterium]|nr:chorismate mutase [Gammaproteobacteria bacterium]
MSPENEQAIRSMVNNILPPELLQARARIDEIDQEIIKLLADRFFQTLQVGRIKASQELQSFDPDRETQKIQKLRQMSEEIGINADLVEALFTQIMQEVVKNHQQLKAEL